MQHRCCSPESANFAPASTLSGGQDPGPEHHNRGLSPSGPGGPDISLHRAERPTADLGDRRGRRGSFLGCCFEVLDRSSEGQMHAAHAPNGSQEAHIPAKIAYTTHREMTYRRPRWWNGGAARCSDGPQQAAGLPRNLRRRGSHAIRTCPVLAVAKCTAGRMLSWPRRSLSTTLALPPQCTPPVGVPRLEGAGCRQRRCRRTTAPVLRPAEVPESSPHPQEAE